LTIPTPSKIAQQVCKQLMQNDWNQRLFDLGSSAGIRRPRNNDNLVNMMSPDNEHQQPDALPARTPDWHRDCSLVAQYNCLFKHYWRETDRWRQENQFMGNERSP
jgi:hypothetical protein